MCVINPRQSLRKPLPKKLMFTFIKIVTIHQRSCGKAMFLQASVCSQERPHCRGPPFQDFTGVLQCNAPSHTIAAINRYILECCLHLDNIRSAIITLPPCPSDIWWQVLETCSKIVHFRTPLPLRSDIWCWPLKYVRFASGRQASYWNVFSFLIKLVTCLRLVRRNRTWTTGCRSGCGFVISGRARSARCSTISSGTN